MHAGWDATIVIPTIGRPSLHALLHRLEGFRGEVIVVDDRPAGSPLQVPPRVRVLASGGRGPAAARNVGWRHASTAWVVFLDDDVLPEDGWCDDLGEDLREAGDAVGSLARIVVPRPRGRAPDDAERNVIALEDSRWITADAAYRRSALAACGGFDERFRRAYREDADLALRLLDAGGAIIQGRRRTLHPLRRGTWTTSIRAQRGNADDQLMRRIHGPRWRRRTHAGAGRLGRHAVTTTAAIVTGASCAVGARRIATASSAVWLVLTADFAWSRIRRGPRDATEVARMLASSIAIPPSAVGWSLLGRLLHRRAAPWRGIPDVVIFDRDGTLVVDVPYNRDPGLVLPVDGARRQLDRLRERGIRVAVATNQSGVAQGLITIDELASVHRRIEDLLGPFDVVVACLHGADDGCGCRKPMPGMLHAACEQLGVEVARSVMVGDIAADVGAALNAGSSSILVPNCDTSPEDCARAPVLAGSLEEAVDRILAGRW